jgi:hypothetical protein
MLVRLKLTSSSTATTLIANITSILAGTMTTADDNGTARPSNLSEVVQAESSVLGTVWNNSSGLYANPATSYYTKTNSIDSNSTAWFRLQSNGNFIDANWGADYSDTSTYVVGDQTSMIDCTSTTGTIDIIVTDKIFAIHQIPSSGSIIFADLAACGMLNAFTESSKFVGCVPTTKDTSGVPDAYYKVFKFPKVWDPATDKYNVLSNATLHTMSSDIIPDPMNQNVKIPLSTCYVGDQTTVFYPVLGIKGFSNTPVFSGGGTMYDTSNNVYYTTGYLAGSGVSTAVVYTTGNAYVGAQILIEGE